MVTPIFPRHRDCERPQGTDKFWESAGTPLESRPAGRYKKYLQMRRRHSRINENAGQSTATIASAPTASTSSHNPSHATQQQQQQQRQEAGINMEPSSEIRQSPRKPRTSKVGFADHIEVISHPSIRFDPSLFYSSEEITDMMEDAIRENENDPVLPEAVSAKGKNTLPLPDFLEQLLPVDDSPECMTTTSQIPTTNDTDRSSEPPRVRESRSQRAPRGDRQQRPKRSAGGILPSRTDMQRVLGGNPSLPVERVRRSRPVRER